MAEKLPENHKINIFGAKQWENMGGQTNFYGSGGIPPVLPPTTENLAQQMN